MSILWEKQSQDNFLEILKEIPDLIRRIAETRVSKKAENLAKDQNRTEITEKDMVDAFFAETPPGFRGDMKKSMRALGIDFNKYGYE